MINGGSIAQMCVAAAEFTVKKRNIRVYALVALIRTAWIRTSGGALAAVVEDAVCPVFDTPTRRAIDDLGMRPVCVALDGMRRGKK